MIDMRNGFDGVNEPVFWDYSHTSDFGNQIIKKKMFEKVLPIVINFLNNIILNDKFMLVYLPIFIYQKY